MLWRDYVVSNIFKSSFLTMYVLTCGTEGPYHACPLAQHCIDERHDGCLQTHFIAIPSRAFIQVIN